MKGRSIMAFPTFRLLRKMYFRTSFDIVETQVGDRKTVFLKMFDLIHLATFCPRDTTHFEYILEVRTEGKRHIHFVNIGTVIIDDDLFVTRAIANELAPPDI